MSVPSTLCTFPRARWTPTLIDCPHSLASRQRRHAVRPVPERQIRVQLWRISQLSRLGASGCGDCPARLATDPANRQESKRRSCSGSRPHPQDPLSSHRAQTSGSHSGQVVGVVAALTGWKWLVAIHSAMLARISAPCTSAARKWRPWNTRASMVSSTTSVNRS
jgi:hypothetical protein